MQRRIDSIFGPKAKTPVRLPRDEDHSWDLHRRTPVPVDSLGPDEWALVTLFLPPEAIACLAMAFRDGRAAARAAMCGCDLSQIPRHLSKCELCAAFRLTASEARQLPIEYVFVSRTALPFVLNLVGGWDALKQRVDKVEEVRLRRIDLNERRAAASKKRRSRLDAWMAAERPFGRGVDSVTKWELSVLHRRHDAEKRPWKDDKILSVFLGNSILKAPTLQEAKAALVALENEERCKAALEAEIKTQLEETKARMEEVAAVLETRGYTPCVTDLALSVVRRYSRRGWKLVSVEDEGKTLGESNATQIAEEIIKEADRRSQEKERRRNLKLALHKRGLTRKADSPTFDAFVERGRTADGLQGVEDVAESMSANWRAGVTGDSIRRCTSVGCNHLHRKVEPAVRSTGPVCGSCERRTAHEWNG